jgi:hypothetical protein
MGIMFVGICLFLWFLNSCSGIKGMRADGATLQCVILSMQT